MGVLPGIGGMLAGVRGPSLTFIGEAGTNTTGAVTSWPAGVQAGDLAVFCAFMFDGGGAGIPSRTTPSGWTVIPNTSGGIDYGGDSVSSVAYVKQLTAGDIASPIPTVNSSHQRCTEVLVFRSSGGFTSWDGVNWNQATAGSGPLNQTITVVDQTVPCVAIAFGGKRYSGGNTLSFTPTADGTYTKVNGTTAGSTIAYKIYNNAPQDQTISYDIDRLISGVVRITGAT